MAGEGNPVSIQDFFKFDDTQGLDQLIDKIQRLDTFYDTLVATAKKGSADISASMQTIQKSIEGLETTMIDADATTKKGQETIAKGADQSAKLTDENEKYKKSLKELDDQIKILLAQQDKLTDGKEKLTKITETESGSLNDLKKQLKEATDAYSNLGKATDSSVKQEALKRITDLNKAVADGNKAVTDAKKATDTAAGSYNELSQKVAAAAKQLKAFEGGVGNTSKEFKELQHFVRDGTEKLKDFDSILGQNGRRVGGYKEEIERLIPALRKINPQLIDSGEAVESLGAKFLTLVSSPIAVGFGAIAGAIALAGFATEQYFTRTKEGILTEEELVGSLKAIWNNYLDAVAEGAAASIGVAIGLVKLLASTVSEDARESVKLAVEREEIEKRRILGIRKRADAELEANKLIFDARNKLQGSDDERLAKARAGDQILENLAARKANRLREIYDIQVKQNRLDYDDIPIKVLQKESELYAEVVAAQNEYLQGSRRRQSLIGTIELEIEQRRLDSAVRELKTQKDYDNLVIQADIDKNTAILANLKSTEKQKLDALQASATDQRQLAANNQAKALADAAKAAEDRIRGQFGGDFLLGLDPEAVQLQLEQDKTYLIERNKITQQYNNELTGISRKLGVDTLAVQNDFIKRRLDNELKAFNERKDLYKADLDAELFANEKVINSSTASLEQKIQAEQANSADRIKILEITRDKAIEAATTETLKKIALEGKELENYLHLAQEKAKIDREFKTASGKEDQGSGDNILKITIDEFTARIAARKRFNAEDHAEELKALSESFQAGTVSVRQYTQQRTKILSDGAKIDLDITIEELSAELDELENHTSAAVKEEMNYATKVAAVKDALREAELAKQTRNDEKLLAAKKKLNEKLMEFEQALVSATLTIGDNLFAAQQQQINDRINQLTAQKDLELQLAGDNANGKMHIEREYNLKLAAEQKKLRKAQHDQAVYDRDIAAVQVVVNIAEGIAKAFGTYPYPVAIGISALLAAIGIAQEAAILSKPIPSYEKGRKGGPAEVAVVHQGELVVEPTGKATLYDTPGATLTHLKAGASVLTAQETQKVMDSAEFSGSLSAGPGMPIHEPVVIIHSDPKLLAAVEANRPIEGIRQGLEWYRLFQDREGNKRLNRSYIGNF